MSNYGMGSEDRNSSGSDTLKRSMLDGGQSRREGTLTKAIERQTAKIPSDVFLFAAGGAVALSAILQLRSPKRMGFFGIPTRQGQLSSFVGQWVPTILMLGLYNKLVKVAGSDKSSSASSM